MRRAVAVACCLLALAACGSGGQDPLRVSVAASLTDAIPELVDVAEAAVPGLEVEVNLGGSSVLVEQLAAGAPVDVLVTADLATMARAAEATLVRDATPFARNHLQVAAPADGPERTPGDLADPRLLVGLCAPEVPCGAAARDALAELGITPVPDTEEPDVRALLTRLTTGDLDVAVVYATDVRSVGGALHGTDLAGATTTLAAAVTTRSTHDDAAAFVRLLTSPDAQRVLAEHGFEPGP